MKMPFYVASNYFATIEIMLLQRIISLGRRIYYDTKIGVQNG